MKRFIITSPKFTGEINVLYGLDNKLQFIDFMKCDLSEEQITFFKNRLPVFYSENFSEGFGKSQLTVMEEGYRVSFDQWWTRYNVKRNRERCIKLWNKLSEADQVNAFFKLGLYERFLALENWRTKAEPDTYLRKRYWENEWK
jgi:hypothetical protein